MLPRAGCTRPSHSHVVCVCPCVMYGSLGRCSRAVVMPRPSCKTSVLGSQNVTGFKGFAISGHHHLRRREHFVSRGRPSIQRPKLTRSKSLLAFRVQGLRFYGSRIEGFKMVLGLRCVPMSLTFFFFFCVCGLAVHFIRLYCFEKELLQFEEPELTL